MFTGIIEEVGRIEQVEICPDLGRFTITCAKVLFGSTIGSSMAVNGVCITIVELGTSHFTFEAVPETLRRSNLGLLNRGDDINLERPMAVDSRFSGHIVQGHVDGLAYIIDIEDHGTSKIYHFETTSEIARYLVEKAYITLDGVSLTIFSCHGTSFRVALIPHTIANINMGSKQPRYQVNVEIDIVAKYIEKLTNERLVV